MSQKILITGGTGFIGQRLCQVLLAEGHHLTVFSRRSEADVLALCGRVEAVANLDALKGHPGFDAVINLAGEGIAEKRWSEARKQVLRDSRIALTRKLVSTIESWEARPEVMVSGSAVGFYGDQGDRIVTEQTPPAEEFSHYLCHDWEQQALELEQQEVRVCLSRTGLVVGPDGGFLQRMLLPFRLGLGGRLGDGRQLMPWVHREDVVHAIVWMLSNPSARGAYNVVSPNPVSNQVFTRSLAGILHRPAFFPVPAAVLRAGLGEMSRLLLTGQRASPERLLEEGYQFRYPDLEPALRDAVRA